MSVLPMTHIANLWRGIVSSEEAWQMVRPIGRGESQSWEVESTGGLRGFAKPAFAAAANTPRAAHEKISADLAVILGVPVPPVTLWTDPSTGHLYSISLSAFAQPVTVAQAGSALTPEFWSNCGPTLAAGLFFHTWIADSDHGGHPENLVIDAPVKLRTRLLHSSITLSP